MTAPRRSGPAATDGLAHRHPTAAVPDRLLSKATAEQRWRDRFSATRIGLADPARDEPDRAVFVSNAPGRYELFSWDVATGTQSVATERPDGTTSGELTPSGEELWWFDDTAGDEFGRWRRQPFDAPPGSAVDALPDVEPGYPAGLELGRTVRLAGFVDDDGTRIHAVLGEAAPTGVYRHPTDGHVAALSRDETIWVLGHSEHGDSRYPALRALDSGTGRVLAELDDTPGKGLAGLEFSPVPGDQRLLVGHERRGRDELLIWDVATGSVTELAIELPGDLSGVFYPDASAVLVVQTHAGRNRLYRFHLGAGVLTELPHASGTISGALVRPDGDVWYRWSSAAAPAQLRRLTPDGVDETLLLPPGEPAPGSEPVSDVWTAGPGGQIHSLLARPREPNGATVFTVHGGPAGADEDAYQATRAAWLDAGFLVVAVNYRGSTGYGSAWRDALTERIGHTELADIAAVQDDLADQGLIDPARCVLSGGSWGGFLTLLGLGSQPDRWAAGVAAVPVADYPAAYADEMEPLRAYDRALFGGSPDEKPDSYRDSSPLTYIDAVRAPVLILAGENDPRCPIRQIEHYLDALAERNATYAVYRFDAGHGSMVIDEQIRQVATEIAFARMALHLTG